jgi:hypothetical protein
MLLPEVEVNRIEVADLPQGLPIRNGHHRSFRLDQSGNPQFLHDAIDMDGRDAEGIAVLRLCNRIER